MSNSKKPKLKNECIDLSSGFVALSNKLLTASLWQNLSHTSKLAYINILYAFLRQWDKDSKRIICPHATIIIPMDKNTWRKSTDALATDGFIEVLRRSGYGKGQYPNIYGLTNDWKAKEKVLQEEKKAKTEVKTLG